MIRFNFGPHKSTSITVIKLLLYFAIEIYQRHFKYICLLNITDAFLQPKNVQKCAFLNRKENCLKIFFYNSKFMAC